MWPGRFVTYWGVRPSDLPRSYLSLLRAPKAHSRDRIAAAREVLDRGWGKAVGFADIEGADPLGQGEVEAEIGSIADAVGANAA